MATVFEPEKSFTRDEIFSAQRIIRMHSYENFQAEDDPIHGQYILSASFREEQTRKAVLRVEKETGRILQGTCSCYHVRYLKQCEHLCVLALLCRSEIMSGNLSPVRRIPGTSDEEVLSLLEEIRFDTDESAGYVSLYPLLVTDSSDPDSISVSFRIAGRQDKSYIIKNITSFTECVRNHETRSYGRYLTFRHGLSAFAPASRKMVRFLLSEVAGEKTDEAPAGIIPYTSQRPQKSMLLRGRALDDFMACARDLACRVQKPSQEESVPLVFHEQAPAIQSSVTLIPDGCILLVTSPKIVFGRRFLYVIDAAKGICTYCSRDDSSLDTAASYARHAGGQPHFIRNSDLPSFARYIYPLLEKVTACTADGFQPEHYLPEKPSFEVRLDVQNGRVSADLTAVYPSGTFHVLAPAQEGSRRDKEEEEQMDALLRGWFDHVDEAENLYWMDENDDDHLFAFLRDGLDILQKKAEVFVSESMHRLRIVSQPHFHIGISVTGSVLQMEMKSDEMTPEEAADILARYDRRKKFIRLKSGAFLQIDDSSAMDALQRLRGNLQLKAKDMVLGTAELPKYRAMYLDALTDSSRITIDKDRHFRTLIQNIREKEADEYPLPSDLEPIMRSYQKDGVRWLSALCENGFGALLADEMGLGKTLQVLAFLKVHPSFRKVLVVCPASLIFNWYAEVRKFTPDLEARMITGNAEERKASLQNVPEKCILITSYDLLKRDIESYAHMKFSCEIIDEAQYIKNAVTLASQAVKAIDSGFRIALTGTPIENRLSELWSIFDFIMPGYFGTYSHFRRTFEIPVVRDHDSLSQEDLQHMIGPFVLRRLKKDVLKDLPDKIEEVYYAYPDEEQRKLYNARVQNLRNNLARTSEKEFSAEKMLVLMELTRLRQICCDPRLLYGNYTGTSAKTELCMSLVRRAVESGHKILLFSQFTSMLEILCRQLRENGIGYHLLTGATGKAQRAEMVAAFQTDDVPVFCISLKAGGTGLNLTAADIVIHYDPWWNTAVENQASDRAHRIGQKNIVTVYRLILKDTVEERILQMQEEKADLAGKMLGGDSISSASLSRDDLLGLL